MGFSTRAICVACRSKRRLLGRQHSVAQALPGRAVECAWAMRWVLAVVTRKWIWAVCGVESPREPRSVGVFVQRRAHVAVAVGVATAQHNSSPSGLRHRTVCFSVELT
jgi:hypothetical protein